MVGMAVTAIGSPGEDDLRVELVDEFLDVVGDGVNIFGEKVVVRAQIHTLNGFSAHAGQKDLLNWLGIIAPSRPRVALIHGEDGPRTTLAGLIRERYGLPSVLPKQGDVIEV